MVVSMQSKTILARLWMMFMSLLNGSRIHKKDESKSVTCMGNAGMNGMTTYVIFQWNGIRWNRLTELRSITHVIPYAMLRQFKVTRYDKKNIIHGKQKLWFIY